ncbi:hypothetical protein DDB_G0278785 [Dictyostelium discoideum AX4]|uniref:Uncharacterized protein n=1 Tax=Dictyostelium discoideum TaxID=44689 RepID=Q54XR9_DICDI|nr:hypothetical protein DDB_G0278785 [Dictyostelium discoideum AX4]EAL67994.1 hypothetical protein DDB_G0278785 [Dictyostelium discoideum AX4]|eukprot:XP_641961.1 hypothetical protein DDB_G0278785 [Dictyostelium discoideum AX4]
MRLLFFILISLCLISSSKAIDYAFFYPPLGETGGLGMGYIVGIGEGCVSYDHQGWAAIANLTDNGIILELYNNYDCKGNVAFTSNFESNSNSIFTIPFNKYDHNNRFVVGVGQPPFNVGKIMVMQFYTTENPTCTGEAPIMKMFINGTYFNSTEPTEEVYCDPTDNSPMTYTCFNGECQNTPYPTNCSNYFSNEIFSNFFCRTISPVPSSNSSQQSSSNESSRSNSNFSGSSQSGSSQSGSSQSGSSQSGSSQSGSSQSGSSQSGSSQSGSMTGAVTGSVSGSGSGSGSGSQFKFN